jgi:hypothetical protein
MFITEKQYSSEYDLEHFFGRVDQPHLRAVIARLDRAIQYPSTVDTGLPGQSRAMTRLGF